MSRFILKCVKCGREYPPNIRDHLCSCGGLLDAVYDFRLVNEFPDENREGIWRYWKLLPIENINNVRCIGAGLTPLLRVRELSEWTGCRNLLIKDESKNPTRTFKDREAEIVINRFRELGLRRFVLCSTGNTAAAYTRAINLIDDTEMFLVVPKNAEWRIDFELGSVRAIALDAPYHDAIAFSKELARRLGAASEGGFANIGRRESMKTLAFEVAESGISPDVYVQAVGSGVGPYGVFKGFQELMELGIIDRIPRIICVQPEACAPMVRAFMDGSPEIREEHVVRNPRTIATTLANGNPRSSYPYIRKIVLDSDGTMLAVSEDEIREAVEFVGRFFSCEPAAAVAWAGLRKAIREGIIDRDEVVLINHSGGNRDNRKVQRLPTFKPSEIDRVVERLTRG